MTKDTSKHGEHAQGHVIRVSGTIMDVQFPRESTPNILNELQVELPSDSNHDQRKASLEVAQQLGDGAVRCIVIETVFGIRRGLPVIDTGHPIKVPVGPEVLGRIFNVLGNTIDDKPPLKEKKRWSIFRNPPPFIEQKLEDEILEAEVQEGTKKYLKRLRAKHGVNLNIPENFNPFEL